MSASPRGRVSEATRPRRTSSTGVLPPAGSAPTGNRVAGNVITANGGAGVVVLGQSVDNPILANRIYANGGPAIDLGGDGITYNSPSPRQGPNNLQNYPVIVTTAAGGLRGWLGGSTPDTTYRIEVFASAALGPDGAGEAQRIPGIARGDHRQPGPGRLRRPVRSAGRPTRRHRHGHRPAGQHLRGLGRAPGDIAGADPVFRDVPGQPLIFSAASGNGIALQDPDAGPLDPEWDLTLSVTAGTLALCDYAGLVGSGNGTGPCLPGPLSALERGAGGPDLHPGAGIAG